VRSSSVTAVSAGAGVKDNAANDWSDCHGDDHNRAFKRSCRAAVIRSQLRPASPAPDSKHLATKFIVIPSAVSSRSWNLIFVRTAAVGAYAVRSQEPSRSIPGFTPQQHARFNTLFSSPLKWISGGDQPQGISSFQIWHVDVRFPRGNYSVASKFKSSPLFAKTHKPQSQSQMSWSGTPSLRKRGRNLSCEVCFWPPVLFSH
jgi:hypothetical protein